MPEARRAMHRAPWPVRPLVWYYRRPLVGYFVLFLLAVYAGVSSGSGEGIMLNVLLLPWVLLVLLVLNLPFLSALGRRLRLTEPERRNHALEHGTIHFLHDRYGPSARTGGRALRHGFRISGVRDPGDIRTAFERLGSLAPEERQGVVVSSKCGSMLVIAQGIGILSLLVVIVLFLIVPPSRATFVAVLGAQLVLFLAVRHPLGFLIQRHRLLSLRFAEARVRAIRQVEAVSHLERPPVYLVETVVR